MTNGNQNYGFNFDRCSISGSTWVRRWKNTFNTPPTAEDPEIVDVEILGVPLDAGMFLEVSFRISETMAGSPRSWKVQATALREAIKATVIVEQKILDNRPRSTK